MTHLGGNHEWLTIPELVGAARKAMDPVVWDYSAGGSDDEVTLRRNRRDFETYAFNARVLTGVGVPDITGSLLGHKLQIPVIFAPVGSIAQFHPDGALASARAASRAGTASTVATLASPSLETVRSGSKCPLVFQLYMYGAREWVSRLVHRAEDAGYSALCVTVDVAAYGRRERDIHNRFFPRESIERPNLQTPGGSYAPSLSDKFNSTFTWNELAWLREITDLPIMLKGIMSATDADLAVAHGVDVVYVSNHGGRQLNHAPSTIDVLPEVVESVRHRAQIVVDSGFMRGSDVVKALALGADAVAIGKLMAWALAAGGEDGLVCATELLAAEMKTVMANLGARDLGELSASMLRRVAATQTPVSACLRCNNSTVHDVL